MRMRAGAGMGGCRWGWWAGGGWRFGRMGGFVWRGRELARGGRGLVKFWLGYEDERGVRRLGLGVKGVGRAEEGEGVAVEGAGRVRYWGKIPFATFIYEFEGVGVEIGLTVWSGFGPGVEGAEGVYLDWSLCDVPGRGCRVRLEGVVREGCGMVLARAGGGEGEEMAIGPGERVEVGFILAAAGGEVERAGRERAGLEERSRRFHRAFFETTLPAWELEAIAASWAAVVRRRPDCAG